MPAYVIVGATPKDPEKQKAYAAAVPQTLKLYGGELVAVGPVEQLHGDFDYLSQVILKFASKEAAKTWYNSAEYQALIPNRNEGMTSQFQLIEYA